MCCVCRQRGHQIHHLDGDPSNNSIENLSYLCLTHHDEASRIGGLARKLTAATIRLFRTEWYRAVELGRLPIEPASATPAAFDRDQILESLAIHEVRKVSHQVRGARSWEALGDACRALSPYALQRSPAISREVLEALHWATTQTRGGMPDSVASLVSLLCREASPTWNLKSRMRREISPAELQVLELAVDVAHGLSYDGAKYLRSLKVVDDGGLVLWAVLRFSHLNKLDDLRQHVEQAFATSISGARDRGDDPFEDAVRWLEFLRADALAVGDIRVPQMPMDLAKQLR